MNRPLTARQREALAIVVHANVLFAGPSPSVLRALAAKGLVERHRWSMNGETFYTWIATGAGKGAL